MNIVATGASSTAVTRIGRGEDPHLVDPTGNRGGKVCPCVVVPPEILKHGEKLAWKSSATRMRSFPPHFLPSPQDFASPPQCSR